MGIALIKIESNPHNRTYLIHFLNMEKRTTGALFSLLFLWTSTVYSQKVISQFALKPSENVRLVEMFDTPILFLENFNRYRFVYLDHQYQLQKMVTIDKIDPRLQKLRVKGMFRKNGMIHIFLEEYDNPFWYVLNINETTQSSHLLEPEAFLAATEKRTEVINLNYFEDHQKYYLFQAIKTETGDLLRIYEIESHEKFSHKDFPLSVPKMFERFKYQRYILPLMTDISDLSVASSVCSFKLYAFPEAFIITQELVEEEKGMTRIFSINREDWTLSISTYPYMIDYSLEIRQQFNSFIYNQHLFQAVVNKNYLLLYKIDMNSGEELDRISFQTDLEINDYFGALPQKQMLKQGKWRTSATYKFLHHLNTNHLGFCIRPIDEHVDQIIIGSQEYYSQDISLGFHVGGIIGIPSEPHSLRKLTYSPQRDMGGYHFPAFRQTAPTYRLVQFTDKLYFTKGYIQKGTFSFLEHKDINNPADILKTYIVENKLDKKGWGPTAMSYPSGFVYGYGRKKQYQFVQFDVSEEK